MRQGAGKSHGRKIGKPPRPAARRATSPPEVVVPPPAPTVAPHVNGAPGRRKVVLILEDYASIGGLVAGLVRQAGYRAVRAWDAEEALRLARGRRPDLVLLDLNAPTDAAVSTLRTVRDDDATRGCPLLVVTAKGLNLETADQASTVGTVDKPFDIDVMLNAVRRAVGDPEVDVPPRTYDAQDSFLHGY